MRILKVKQFCKTRELPVRISHWVSTIGDVVNKILFSLGAYNLIVDQIPSAINVMVMLLF